jgi:hypothetical protein
MTDTAGITAGTGIIKTGTSKRIVKNRKKQHGLFYCIVRRGRRLLNMKRRLRNSKHGRLSARNAVCR